MKKKTIKILTINLDKGGAEKVVVSKINYFLKKSYFCELYLLQNLVKYNLPRNANFKIINYYQSFKSKFYFFQNLIKHIKFLKKNFKSTDVVISHLNKSNYINILTSILLTHHKTIVVIHNHPNHYIHSYAFVKSYYKFFVHYLIQMILYRFANEVVTISNESKLFYKHYYNLDTTLIYNPIDLNFTKNLNTNYHLTENINNKKIFLSVGRLSRRKNQIEVLKTFLFIKENDKELYNKIFLYIVGEGEKLNFLKEFVLNNKLEDSVKIVGLIDNLAPYYNNSHCLISTAKAEGLPNIFIEAQSFYKPIISSDYSGYYETLVDDHKNYEKNVNKAIKLQYGIVYPKGNIEQLYKSIDIITNDQIYYSKITKNLRSRSNLFSILNTNKYLKLLNIYADKFKKSISVAHIVPNMNYGGVEVAIHRSINELNNIFDYKVYTVKKKGIMNVGQKNIFSLVLKCFFSKHRPNFIITSLWWSHPFGLFLSLTGIKWISFFHDSQYAHLIDSIVSKIVYKFSPYNFFDSNATMEFHSKKILFQNPFVIPYLFKSNVNINQKVEKDIDFIFVGRNHQKKRLDLVNYLIKILSLKIKKAKFLCIVAGEVYKPFTNLLTSDINIDVQYNIENSKVQNYLKRSKFYLQLSDYEGMSMTTVEAIQNSVLPIIRPVGELKNILNDSNSIIIKGDNKIYLDNALEQIVKIYNDKKSMIKISSLARKKLKKFPYYTSTISKNINQIYSIK